MVNSDIRMVIRLCRCCNVDADRCVYLSQLRRFGIGSDNDILNTLAYEIEVPHGPPNLDR